VVAVDAATSPCDELTFFRDETHVHFKALKNPVQSIEGRITPGRPFVPKSLSC
jgi:hypothetical protein